MENKNSIDIKYLDVPNICFSLTDKEDSREELFREQRIERGFDNSETWSLRDTIANFTLPRLKVFKEQTIGCPGSFETIDEWYAVLDKMIKAFEYVARDKGSFILTDEEFKEYEEGMDLFKEWFLALWW